MHTAVFHVLFPRKSHGIHEHMETNKLQEKWSHSMYEYNEWKNSQMHDYVWSDSRTSKVNQFCTKAFLIKIILNS